MKITVRTKRLLWAYFILTLFTSPLFADDDMPDALLDENLGKQCIDGNLARKLNPVKVNIPATVTIDDFRKQVEMIKLYAPNLYKKNASSYKYIENLAQKSKNRNTITLNQQLISGLQLGGAEQCGNVLLTSYFTPVIHAKKEPNEQYKYPIYAKPSAKLKKQPTRAEIYNGALDGLGLEIAFTDSLIDGYLLEIQGSGYVDFGDDENVLFAFDGKNGHPYASIGRLLIEAGILTKQNVSLKGIKDWADTQTDEDLKSFLAQNRSSVYFKPKLNEFVKGSAGVPLIPMASVASDRRVVPSGSVLLVEMPILDEHGNFTAEREYKLMIALDIGGAINGHHLDIYQGIGEHAGKLAGFYHHYGRVWILGNNTKKEK